MHLRFVLSLVPILLAGCLHQRQLSGVAEAAPARYTGPIIDVHLHASPYSNFGGAAPNPVTGIAAEEADDEEQMRRSLAAMEEHNIRLGIASGTMDLVNRWREAAGGKLLGGLYLGEYRPWPPIEEIRTFLERDGNVLLGELGLQYAGISPSDAAMEPYWELAEELKVPVAIHTGLGPPGTPFHPGTGAFRVGLGNPMELEEMLVRHPDVPVYLMHGGWPYLQETIAILYMYEQVYVDIAVINWIIPREEFHKYLEALMVAGMGKRIMFGSDQMIWPEAIGMAIDGVDSAPFLSAEEKADIFYNNAVRFFGWENVPPVAGRAAGDAGAPNRSGSE